MALAFLIALQAAAAPGAASAEGAPAAVAFDLAELTRRQQAEAAAAGCSRRSAGEIVVCGRRPGAGDYDMEKWEKIFREEPLVAETDLGGGVTGRAYVEQVDFGQGMVSKRAMVGIRLPF
ncbi:MAG TPA: hypothetical protein VGB70_08110 [Allosphingosinicella sp.]|jgi:hypothetical protein